MNQKQLNTLTLISMLDKKNKDKLKSTLDSVDVKALQEIYQNNKSKIDANKSKIIAKLTSDVEKLTEEYMLYSDGSW